MYDKFGLALGAALVVLLLSSCTTTYLIRGEGGTSCATVVERLRSQPEYRGLYEAWLLGYLTHYNYQNQKKLGSGFDNATLLSTATQYCEKNPLHDFSTAAEGVIKELEKSG